MVVWSLHNFQICIPNIIAAVLVLACPAVVMDLVIIVFMIRGIKHLTICVRDAVDVKCVLGIRDLHRVLQFRHQIQTCVVLITESPQTTNIYGKGIQTRMYT